MEFIQLLEKYWTIITAFVAIVVSYTTLRNQNADQEKRINCLESDIKAVNSMQMKIEIALAEIQMDLKWIK